MDSICPGIRHEIIIYRLFKFLHAICVCFVMFLTNPTPEELLTLDINSLADMMAKQTVIYDQLYAEEPMSSRTATQKDFIRNIQKAIDQLSILEGRTPA